MAFVFQTERWKHAVIQNDIGPGHYNSSSYSKLKGGVITPDHSCTKQQFPGKKSPCIDLKDQNLQISRQIEKKKSNYNEATTKQYRRAVSAKIGLLKNQKSQSPTIFKSKDLNLEVNNSNNHQKKSFQNSIIKTSFKKTKKSIHSEVDTLNKKPFCDKNLRTMDSNKSQIKNDKKENIDFFNSMFSKSSSNPNLMRFVQKKAKTQNVFVSKQPSFLKQNENFIIASENCRKKTRKPSNAETSLKESCSFQKLDAYDTQTTAMQDSLDSSFQYITDSTPGPGQYELRKQKIVYKSKIERFGITEKRFKQSVQNEKRLNLNIQIPSFKKQSRASQQKVGFGKIRPQTAKQNKTEFLFYEDHHTIENKCIRNLIKDRQAPGTFMIKSNRFRNVKKQAYFGPDFFQKHKKKQIVLPNSIFMSKVERHSRPVSPTANIDYQGQNYKTIEEKAQKLKEKKQLIDGQTPGFYISEPRFKYKPREETESPTRKTNLTENGHKKELKSFTFRKDGMICKDQNTDNPAPWQYKVEMKWIKPSHHVRYKF